MKILRGILMGLFVVLGLSFYTYTNIKHHSVYYAQHMPHKEGTEPDLVMLIENMGWIYTPEIEGIRYDDDGGNAIENIKNKTVLSKSLGKFLYHKNTFTVGFDSTFRFNHVSHFSDGQEKIHINELKIKQEIRENFSSIIKSQTKPIVNLQWMFNLIYQSRFN